MGEFAGNIDIHLRALFEVLTYSTKDPLRVINKGSVASLLLAKELLVQGVIRIEFISRESCHFSGATQFGQDDVSLLLCEAVSFKRDSP